MVRAHGLLLIRAATFTWMLRIRETMSPTQSPTLTPLRWPLRLTPMQLTAQQLQGGAMELHAPGSAALAHWLPDSKTCKSAAMQLQIGPAAGLHGGQRRVNSGHADSEWFVVSPLKQ